MSHQITSQSPRVSVLMAVYNCQAYVAEAIESILNQTLTDLELIVIDDGSTDSTWQIVTTFSELDPRLKALRNEHNAGKAVSINRGLLESRGEFIAWQDGDDFSMPERLAEQVAYLESNPNIGVVSTASLLTDEAGIPMRVAFDEVSNNDEIQQALLDRMCLGAAIMSRRQSMEAIGFRIDETFNTAMDYELSLRLSEVTQMANIVKPLYGYRQHNNSMTSNQRSRQMFNEALALERAVYRRFGPKPTVEQFGNVGRDYLRAAIIGFANNQYEQIEEALQQATRFNPSLFESREPVETCVSRYTPRDSIEKALDFTESLFDDLLPNNRNLAKVKSRLLSRLHMAEVFSGVEQNDPERVARHLWSGIRHDPSWLLNRGVLSLISKEYLGLEVRLRNNRSIK